MDEQQAQASPTAGGAPIYQIRIDLKGARPPIWRRLLIPSDYPLDIVHLIIQSAMGWTDSHLHMFYCRGKEIGDPATAEYDLPSLDEGMFTLADVLSREGEKIEYEYDFGDSWRHVLKLEKVLPPSSHMIAPICIAGKRACPPEDVGGIWGYAGFLAAYFDPNHPEHDSIREWYDEEFDPEAFDAAETTELLQHLIVEL